jgi:TatD DNase family protein
VPSTSPEAATERGWIDTHTHLESFARAGELESTLRHAREAGLEALITIGTSLDDWALYRDLTEANPALVRYTVGLHPCAVEEDWERHLAGMAAFWAGPGPRPLAVGEIGLDRFHLPKEAGKAAEVFARQTAAFREGLRFAASIGAPVVVHSRGAFAECVRLVDESGVDWRQVVFHCFVEGAAEMAELLRRGGRGSVTGIVSYKTADALREAARLQGLERLMLETDAPYLAPVPHRGKRNEPAFLPCIGAAVAAALGVSEAEVRRRSTENALQFFALP